jgi:hypothetical protein
VFGVPIWYTVDIRSEGKEQTDELALPVARSMRKTVGLSHKPLGAQRGVAQLD